MNLESEIYQLSFELSEAIDKNNLQKLLGVLSNDGVYAMWVYAMDKLDWKFSDNPEEMKKMKLFKLLNVVSKLSRYLPEELNFDDPLNEIAELTKKINDAKENNQKNVELEYKCKRKKVLNQNFQTLAQNLNKLLFMKELLERVLIYARYHAKAIGDQN